MRSICVLFGVHSDVNDAHRAGANRLQNNKLLHVVHYIGSEQLSAQVRPALTLGFRLVTCCMICIG